jgi:hypothetical protein
MQKLFTIGGVFREARGIIKPQLWKVLKQFIVIELVLVLASILAGNNMLLSIIVSSISAFVMAFFALGYAKHGTFSFKDFFESLSFKSFAYFFLAYIISKLVILGGFILLIIPGIVLSVRLCLVNFIASEKQVDLREALKESVRLTRGYRWKILGFFVAAFFFNVLGFLCLIVGGVYTSLVTVIAFGLIYKKLKEGNDFVPNIVEVIETEVEILEPSEAAA